MVIYGDSAVLTSGLGGMGWGGRVGGDGTVSLLPESPRLTILQFIHDTRKINMKFVVPW